MSTDQVDTGEKRTRYVSSSASSLLFRLIFLAILDGLALWFVLSLAATGGNFFWLYVAILTVIVNVIFLRSELYPLRWMALGLVLMALFAIYPILFTFNIAFTNFGDGHLLNKDQAIKQLLQERYLPEGGNAYTWTAYVTPDGEYALWLQSTNGESLLAFPDEPIRPVTGDEAGIGPLDSKGIPESIEGYKQLNRIMAAANPDLDQLRFGTGDSIVQISSPNQAAELQPTYVYYGDTDKLVDTQTGIVYFPREGAFTAENGDRLIPGWSAQVGFSNFTTFFGSTALQGPLVRIIIWNFTFAFLAVFLNFSLGLLIALLFNDPKFPGRKLIRTVLLVPYTIPVLITVIVWRGMLNPEVGIINRMLEQLFGVAPAWFTNPFWAKVGVLLVNLWLGFPYFMLICTGALQAIPSDIYSAAEVDGAGIFAQFRRITLPLLLVSVGPLLLASFVFNFNNFNVIFLFIEGGPPMAGTVVRAGHTDILISFVYNLAFAGGRGADYGLASAITIIIFVIVAVLTLFQFRFTNMWEEVSENV